LRVPLVDLEAQYRIIGDELAAAVERVLASGRFILGPFVEEFEEAFARSIGVREVIGVSSGTSALHLALLAAGIEEGDEVIVPAMTFLATAAAVSYVGAVPVLVDVEPQTWTLDPDQLEAAIGPSTRAVIPVHLYGRIARMDAICEVAERHDLFVIEDAAQAHGAMLDGRAAGSMSTVATFSFYPGKNLGACGEGGAVVTDEPELAEKVRMLRDWGQREKGRHDEIGFNYRMDGIQGAVLAVKLRHLEDWTARRRAVARAYDLALAEQERIDTPRDTQEPCHVNHVYAVQVHDRDRVRGELAGDGVLAGVHYPLAIHENPCYRRLGYETGRFPVAERLARSELSLPIYAEITDEQIEHVTRCLIERCAASTRFPA
jgi:dTDP-4-amino-4,6-dideoxygalactose transaminase